MKRRLTIISVSLLGSLLLATFILPLFLHHHAEQQFDAVWTHILSRNPSLAGTWTYTPRWWRAKGHSSFYTTEYTPDDTHTSTSLTVHTSYRFRYYPWLALERDAGLARVDAFSNVTFPLQDNNPIRLTHTIIALRNRAFALSTEIPTHEWYSAGLFSSPLHLYMTTSHVHMTTYPNGAIRLLITQIPSLRMVYDTKVIDSRNLMFQLQDERQPRAVLSLESLALDVPATGPMHLENVTIGAQISDNYHTHTSSVSFAMNALTWRGEHHGPVRFDLATTGIPREMYTHALTTMMRIVQGEEQWDALWSSPHLGGRSGPRSLHLQNAQISTPKGTAQVAYDMSWSHSLTDRAGTAPYDITQFVSSFDVDFSLTLDPLVYYDYIIPFLQDIVPISPAFLFVQSHDKYVCRIVIKNGLPFINGMPIPIQFL